MSEKTPAYLNPKLSVEERVQDLLSRMTLEEKVGQITMWDARDEGWRLEHKVFLCALSG